MGGHEDNVEYCTFVVHMIMHYLKGHRVTPASEPRNIQSCWERSRITGMNKYTVK